MLLEELMLSSCWRRPGQYLEYRMNGGRDLNSIDAWERMEKKVTVKVIERLESCVVFNRFLKMLSSCGYFSRNRIYHEEVWNFNRGSRARCTVAKNDKKTMENDSKI